ncbi:glycine zipper 2TM domain-containing protein [Ramlibacter humi]|uniref:Glycine zipper 2TM domain-containing protein n=1 Tax=Ramlibacter humi TaxID=2530451 RepID=A0A4Z0BQ91_9BURK|nr:glycine zipper 2TM domain-containing protein [Ramlibacter humi]TFZ00215.1 glycine zipper 2TM domain-containing protein [Ramlibacter humi]
MKKSVVIALAALAGTAAVQAQEVGRVLSTTPVIQQVAVPRQICNQQAVAVEQPTTGAGGVMGAIAGGAIGSTIGAGSGRGVATVIGALGGAVLGNNLEGGNRTQLQNVQQCTTQTFYENRATSYNVVYEYAGRQYQVNMPNDPGPTVQLQVTPVNAAPPPPQTLAPVQTAPIAAAPVYVQPAPTVVVPSTVVYPAYYPRPYYYPPVSLSLGYVWGGGHHRHWR